MLGPKVNGRILNRERNMNCPVCANTLTSVRAGAVTVDLCVGGCGGIWFDQFELQKLDGPDEPAGDLLGNVRRRADLQIDPSQRRHCPRCNDIVMMRHFYSPLRRVEVDECPNCGGYWLDAGELALIRQEHADRQTQQEAVEKYLNEASASILGPMRTGSPKEAERARRIGQLFRFSSPIQFEEGGPRP
jgi:Zn-finger nucleic acid-binding protein